MHALVFYTPIPFLILFGKTEFAIYLAGSGSFLIVGLLLLYAMGVRGEMSLNLLKVIREDPKAALIGFAIIGGVVLICRFFNMPPRYP